MNQLLQIALDGPSGAGKSSVAKTLARLLDLTYLDTGGLFRVFALALDRDSVATEDVPTMPELIARYNIMLLNEGETLRFILNGEDVSSEIRLNHMSQLASSYSRLPAVREAVLQIERQIADAQPVIMDGRDIGSVVLPEAPFKIFLTASAEERARRRYLELQDRGQTVPYETLLQEIQARDLQDMTREAAPLICVPEAHRLDSTNIDFDGVIREILDYLELEAKRIEHLDMLDRLCKVREGMPSRAKELD